MCAMQTGVLFLSLSGSGGGNSNIYIKGLPAVLEGVGQLGVAHKGLPNNALSAPKLANFLLHLFQVGLGWPYHWYLSFCYFCIFGASSHLQGI